MSDEERQRDEIEVLESIYDSDLTVSSKWPIAGCLRISSTPPTEEFDMNVITIINEKPIEKNIKLKYLLPMELYFKCPTDYPSKSQPFFMLKCAWLSENKLSSICHHLDLMWDRHDQSEILFEWASFLKEDCCSFLEVEHLSFTLNVNQVDTLPLPRAHDNLKLKELKNRSYDRNRAVDKCSINRNYDNTRRRRICRNPKLQNRQNFKYETPKDEENREQSSIQGRISTDSEIGDQNDECTSSSQAAAKRPHCAPVSAFEYILKMMPVYGIRRKSVIDESDRRVLPTSSQENANIVQRMIDYNDERLDKIFRSDWHFCGICFEQKSGTESVRIQPCSHVFCQECVHQYLSINITNGNVLSLCCPHVGCDTSLSSSQIRRNVDEDTFGKYEKFSKKMAVESDPLLMYCPREICQSVARRCIELSPDMCYCCRCCYYFCLFCKKAYHGVQPCQLKNEEKLKVVREYQKATPARQAELEKRYTKPQIRKWVDEYLTDEWLEQRSKPCPNCNARIQKNDGCNKMLCSNCNVPFCWLCNKCLSRNRPYDHFTDPKSPCYQQLFPAHELEAFDLEEELDDEWFDEYDGDDDLIDFDYGYGEYNYDELYQQFTVDALI